MYSIVSRYFDTFLNYPDTFQDLTKIKITYEELLLNAQLVGDPYIEDIPQEILDFKLATIKAIIEKPEGTSQHLMLKNLGLFESSEQAAVAFSFGMVFATIMVQKLYNVRYLYHVREMEAVKSGRPSFTFDKEGNFPDLVGVDINEEFLYIVEAKGSLNPKGKISSATISKAHQQVNSINSVTYYSLSKNTKVYFPSRIKRVISATHPVNLKSFNDTLTPPLPTSTQKGTAYIQSNIIGVPNIPMYREFDIDISYNDLVYYHYKPIAELILNGNFPKTEDINGVNYTIAEYPSLNIRIGLVSSILQLILSTSSRIKDTQVSEQNKRGLPFIDNQLYEKVEAIFKSDEMKLPYEGKDSIGIDGVLIGKVTGTNRNNDEFNDFNDFDDNHLR